MFQIASASLLTWSISYLSTHLIKQGLNHQGRYWLKHTDQLCRGAMLGFVLAQVLPHNLAHFGTVITLLATTGILGMIHAVEKIYEYHCQTSLQQDKPWFNYILLAPHCIIEGFAAAPYFMGEQLSYIYISLFFWHKISELSMITVSTELHVNDKKQQRFIQQIFALLTPIAMLIGAYAQVDTYWLSDSAHAVLDLVNMSIFIHIALFCQFCRCKHNPGRNWHIHPHFLLACTGLYLLLTFMVPGATPCPHSHNHDHLHSHSHHHKH